MKRFVLAHDLGTTGNKASLFDDAGRLVAHAFYGYDVIYPQPTWAEQNPFGYWNAVVNTTRQLLNISKISPDEIAAISFSGQMQGCLPVDKNGQPLGNCIIWADQRAVKQAEQLDEWVGQARVYRITGHRISPTYSLPKLMWLRDNAPDIFSKLHKALHVKDYVAFRMTGKFVTDRSDASGMNLYNLDAGNWSDEILDAVKLDSACLPEIHNSTDVIGELTREAAEELGLVAGIPVAIGGGDGASATVGAGCVEAGPAYTYIGSSAWIAFASEKPIYDPSARVFNFAHMVPGMFAPCGTMQAAGGSYQWLQRQLCGIEAQEAEQLGEDVYEIMNRRAVESAPGAHGLLFLPYLQGERSPHWNPKARGGFVGLQITHTRADLIRATLEGISLNLRTILYAFLDAGGQIDRMMLIGGGAQGALWNQILADVYNRPALRPRLSVEATSLGAAIAGGVGVGLYKDFSMVQQCIEIENEYTPNPENVARYDQLYPTFLQAYTSLVPVFDALSELC